MALTNGCEHNERPEALSAEQAISVRQPLCATCRVQVPTHRPSWRCKCKSSVRQMLQYLLLLTYFLSNTHDVNGSSQSDAKYKMSDLGNRSGGFAQVFSVHRVVQFVWGNLSWLCPDPCDWDVLSDPASSRQTGNSTRNTVIPDRRWVGGLVALEFRVRDLGCAWLAAGLCQCWGWRVGGGVEDAGVLTRVWVANG